MVSYSIKSQNTKKTLSAALKKLMEEKDFNKITINDLVKEAHLNRNSFYYHFNNIFDLLKYTFENDTVKIVKQIDPSHNLEEIIYFIMTYIDQNKTFCTCAYKSLGKTELRKFLRNNFQDIIINTIEDAISENEFQVSNDFKNYVIYSHTELMAVHVIGYLENESNFSKEQMAKYILLMFNASVMAALKIADVNRL